jgi:predicted outer membrane repeat protein
MTGFVQRRFVVMSPWLLAVAAAPLHGADIMVPSQFATLQAAHDAAQSGDRILVSSGSFLGSAWITKPLTIEGPADGSTSCRVGRFTVSNSSSSGGVRFSRLRFQDNFVSNDAGGTLRLSGSVVQISDCAFVGNSATYYGGAIYCEGSTVVISDCRFENNRTSAPSFSYPFGGGAIAGGGSQISISRCGFLQNSAGPGTGGAISGRGFNNSYSNVTVKASVFCGNSAERGGSALNGVYGGDGCVFRNCTAGGASLVIGSLSPRAVTTGCQFPPAQFCASDQSADCGAFVPADCALGLDCDSNGLIDYYELAADSLLDCDQNFVIDSCELASGAQTDCNGNGIIDQCDLASGVSRDNNGNGVPDECDPITCVGADLFRDFSVNGADLGILLSQWGPDTTLTVADINNDGFVDGADLGFLLSFWGACP